MAYKRSRFELPRRDQTATNPIVLNAFAATWIFWILVGIVVLLIIAATYWLLAHPPIR